MTALVIHAHPVPDSLNRALFDAAVEGLTLDGRRPDTASLCNDSEGGTGDDPTAADLEAVTTLVFVYPTWWGGPPAILLDWIERRLGPWIDGSPDEPTPIASVANLAVVTTHGSPRMLNRVTGEPGRHLFADSIRSLCAPACDWHWLAYYGIDADNTESRAAFVAAVPAKLRDL